MKAKTFAASLKTQTLALNHLKHFFSAIAFKGIFRARKRL